jgi:SAM-dependent methyltransferase
MEENTRVQQEHYHRIHDEYQQHYFDPTSMVYREKFIFDPMLNGLDLNGKLIADLACGGGANTLAIKRRFLNSKMVGFDVSTKACEDYRNSTNGVAYELDLTSGEYNSDLKFDAAVIIGGLHHCSYNLSSTFLTISKLLKPGGYLLLCEPNAKFFLEVLRRAWYRNDFYFEPNTERALEHDQILRIGNSWFVGDGCQYIGGPAYFLILNSLILRVPLRSKKYIAPVLMKFEVIYNKLPGIRPYPYFVARWRRN